MKALTPVVPPPMTTAQRNALVLPPTGAVIYNTDTKAQETNVGTPSVPAWAGSGVTPRVSWAGLSAITSPFDGQQVEVVDDLANPTYWFKLRYNAGRTTESGAYKWEGDGGEPLFLDRSDGLPYMIQNNGTQLFSLGAVVPRTGIWGIEVFSEWGCQSASANGDTNINMWLYLSGLDLGVGMFRAFRKQTDFTGSTMNDSGNIQQERHCFALAGQTFQMQISAGASGGSRYGFCFPVSLRMWPIRV